ncbi:MAG: 23S rRNA (guanosine(2251)-2'-O)-methyltransferase RlmB [Clostridia bacterium]|nr:23S rRNA (guanosine(2251)-2'-O)-methyltransferase RlmB [Clostridia bacterium]
MSLITSNQNPIVKEIKSLKEKKIREEKRQFFIEGIRFVEEALKEDCDISSIVVSERFPQTKGAEFLLNGIHQAGVKYHMLSDKIFREISDTENPQGILAVIKMKEVRVENVLQQQGLFILLESIQDPGNMGTIIRTADAAGVNGIILSKGCVDIYNPKVLRSTMGSIFHVPVCQTENFEDTLQILKEKGIKILAAHLKGQTNYFDQDMKDRVAIIIGNEANGISDEVAALADVLVRIPMPGKAESLNASIAAGLLIYETVRQQTHNN